MFLSKSEGKAPNLLRLLQKNWLWGVTILLVTFSRICWYGIFKPYIIYPDSNGYINFETLAMLRGEGTNGRAPLYGAILDFVELLFPANFLSATSIIQAIVSTLSIFVLAKILTRIGIRSPWCQFCVLFYGVTPAVLGWDTCILTKSFSISGAVFFFYFVVKYIQEHRFRDGALCNLISVALLFLRPQFLVYLALLLVFYILKLFFPYNKKERNTIFALLVVQLLCWAMVLFYCAGFEKQSGIFSINDALPRQNLVICVDRGYYKDLDDFEISQYLTQHLAAGEDGFDVCIQAVKVYGNERVDKTTKQYFAEHFWKYFWDTMKVINEDLGSGFCGYAINESNYNPDASRFFYMVYPIQLAMFQRVLIVHVLIASVLEGVAMMVVWIGRRTLPWMHMALFSISVCTTFLTYFVTCGEYMRTMISILPYFVCMIGLFLQMCSDASTKLKEKL